MEEPAINVYLPPAIRTDDQTERDLLELFEIGKLTIENRLRVFWKPTVGETFSLN